MVLKRFGFVAGLLLLFLLLSCNDDDDGTQETLINVEVIGLWDLVEVNVSPPQDINRDGMASSNLMDEMDCLTGTLLIDSDLIWTYEQSNLEVTSITGEQYNIECSGRISGSGSWFSNDSEVDFGGENSLGAFRIVGNRLINEIGENLPGLQSFVYERRND